MEEKVISTNRYASHEYFILEKIETGIVLEGSEVKSLRINGCNLKDSFCFHANGEIILKNMHISIYDKAGSFNSKDARRDRKLLLHKDQIVRLCSKVVQKGLTLVPLKIYFKQALVKVELGLCQGKHTYDKKRSIMEKDLNREKEREMKKYK